MNNRCFAVGVLITLFFRGDLIIKKFVCVLVAFAVCICCSACKNASAPHYSGDGVEVIYPERNSGIGSSRAEQGSVSNAEQSVASQSAIRYYANTSSKKFHKESCRYAKKLKNEYLYICDDRQQLINEGYTPCGICKP